MGIFRPQDFTTVNMQIIMILQCLQLLQGTPEDTWINRQKTELAVKKITNQRIKQNQLILIFKSSVSSLNRL